MSPLAVHVNVYVKHIFLHQNMQKITFYIHTLHILHTHPKALEMY